MSEKRALLVGLGLALVVVAGLGYLSVAGARWLLHEEYPQHTPEEVLVSARRMVENGHAKRLPDLIYADDARMRALLGELGVLMGSLQELGLAVQGSFPEEIEKLRAEAEATAKQGQASSFIQRMAGSAMPAGRRRGGRGGGGGDPDEMRKAFNNAMKELFADPYGWLEESEGRLSVQTITDDTAAILWDGKPLFGIGLLMRQDAGKWYVALPTNAPGISRIVPKSDEAWQVMGNLVGVFDQMIKDLTVDVRRGRIANLEDLGHKAGEKAFIPAAIVLLAYGKIMEEERKEAQRAGR
jgi:hypothetical protein